MNPFYQQAQKLRKTDNLEAVIYKFGQLGLRQAKHFIPPFTRAGEDPVPATDADAKKLVDALAVRRSIKLTGDVIYPFVGEKTTPISYNQSHIDCIWALLDYIKTRNIEKNPWDFANEVIVGRDGCVYLRFIADAKTIVNVVPVENDEQLLALKLEGDEFQKNPDEYTTYLAVTRDKALLSKYVSMGISLPITFCILDGSPLDDPSEIKYLTRKK